MRSYLGPWRLSTLPYRGIGPAVVVVFDLRFEWIANIIVHKLIRLGWDFIERRVIDVPVRLCIPWLLVAIVAWTTSACGQPPSVIEGKKSGIEVGQYAPDFELQPIEPYAKLREWLGENAPKSIEEKVKLSRLVGKQPILLLYGSYT